ncbi:hypothetical protein XalbCFBP2523_00845 [Xanthomonas albilineans]|nr:hypothetical protein XalbCFBP2523_00845 [Xanthomonas albilineans]
MQATCLDFGQCWWIEFWSCHHRQGAHGDQDAGIGIDHAIADSGFPHIYLDGAVQLLAGIGYGQYPTYDQYAREQDQHTPSPPSRWPTL